MGLILNPPDFSVVSWSYDRITFHYLFNKKWFSREISQDELHQLSNKQILEKIKEHESQAYWFCTNCRFKDLDVDDYAVKYKNFRHHPKETLVFGYDWRIFGRSVIKSLQFIAPEADGERCAPGNQEISGRVILWFLQPDGLWREADFGDTFDIDCITKDETGNEIEKVVITVLDFYQHEKTQEKIEIYPDK